MNNKPNDIVLLAGFEAFAGFSVNPSAEIARELDGNFISGHEIKGMVLPVVFNDSAALLERAIEELNPRVVICLGLAADRKVITPERIAVNLEHANIPDSAGLQPLESPIVPEGPAAYWSTLPVQAMVEALRKRDIPAELSLSAGAYVCNHVFYRLMHFLEGKPGIRGGFVHAPPFLEQAGSGEPVMTMDVMTNAVKVIIETALMSADHD